MNADVIRVLAGTKGWVRFLAVLGFLFCALLVVLVLVMFFTINSASILGSRFSFVIGGLYLLMATIYFVVASKLNQYASRINTLIQQPSQLNLVAALDSQREFWKCVGIMAILFVGLYLLGMFFATLL